MNNNPVTKDQKTLFRYYCEAILILGHFQRPGAVEGFSVSEWINRKTVQGRVCIGISQHKTATMQIASFALTMEEAAMLEAFYLYIRPDTLTSDGDDNGRFFISSTGTPLRSATNDLSRLHAQYRLENVSSQKIRRVVETQTASSLPEEQRRGVAHYMAHTNAVAELHYRMRTQEDTEHCCAEFSSRAQVSVNNAAFLRNRWINLETLSFSSDESVGGDASRKTSRDEDPPLEPIKSFEEFISVLPIALNGQPPTKIQRTDAGFNADRFNADRCCYDKWRATQFAKREGYMLSKFYRHPPTVSKVTKLIQREGWTANYPQPEDIVGKWKPAPKCQLEEDPRIFKRVVDQKWSGVAITDFEDKRGQGV
ncbi:uncharacterized protein [Nothobranchius furzeri]|uniref:uncharacterized protein n=1 Tax=Nothobranchius furzeri TaxID=105023 RepID=UPI003904A62D